MSKDYISGYWAALNRVLNLINEFENKTYSKAYFYKKVFELRPEKIDA